MIYPTSPTFGARNDSLRRFPLDPKATPRGSCDIEEGDAVRWGAK